MNQSNQKGFRMSVQQENIQVAVRMMSTIVRQKNNGSTITKPRIGMTTTAHQFHSGIQPTPQDCTKET
jgi:hypothetical protein